MRATKQKPATDGKIFQQACWYIGKPNPKEHQRTVVVLGAARGGTSMIAGVLRLLGVNMGSGLNSSHENRLFRTALFGNKTFFDYCLVPVRLFTRYYQLIRQFDEEGPIWGIKDPYLNPYLFLLARFWRNPVYILVLRHPIVTAQSHAKHFKRPFFQSLSRVIRVYQDIYRFALASGRPLLVINYEAALQNKEAVIKALANYCSVEPDPLQKQIAFAFMDKEKGYQWLMDEKAPLVGFIETISVKKITGWAFNPQSQDPITVVLLHKGIEIDRTVAQLARPDVLASPSFARLQCGFSFTISQYGTPLAIGQIEVVDAASNLSLMRIDAN